MSKKSRISYPHPLPGHTLIIAWGVLWTADGGFGAPKSAGWLRPKSHYIHGIGRFLSYQEAEDAMILDAAQHPERLGNYELRPEYEGSCGSAVPCSECRRFL